MQRRGEDSGMEAPPPLSPCVEMDAERRVEVTGNASPSSIANCMLSGCGATRLSMSEVVLDDAGARLVARAIECCPELASVYLENVSMEAAGAEAVMRSGCSVPSFDLTRCRVSDGASGAACLARALRGGADAARLAVSESGADEAGWRAVGEALQGGAGAAGLAELFVSYERAGDGGAEAVAAAVASCPVLARLYLWSCGFGRAGAEALARAAAASATLCELDVSHNAIGDGGAAAVAVAIAESCTLAKVRVYDCGLGAAGGVALGRALERGGALTELDASANREFGDEGAAAVARALRTNRTLTALFLSSCGVGPAGGRAIGEALATARGTALLVLDLAGNSVGDDGAEALARALGRCALQSLTLATNRVGDRGAVALAEAVGRRPPLTRLRMDFCSRVGAAGGHAFGRALAVRGCALTDLDLSFSRLGEEGMAAIAAALDSGGCSLRCLALGDVTDPPAAEAAVLAAVAGGRNASLLRFRYRTLCPDHARAALERNRAAWQRGRVQRAALSRAPGEHLPWLIPDLARIVAAYAGDPPGEPAPW